MYLEVLYSGQTRCSFFYGLPFRMSMCVRWNDDASVTWLAVDSADLSMFWMRGNCLFGADVQFEGITFRIGTLSKIWVNCKSFPLAPHRLATFVRVPRFT